MKKTLLALVIALALPSCRAPKPIAQEHARYAADTIYIARERADTVAIRDSVSADTAGRIIYRERQVWRTRTRVDTLWRIAERTDTVCVTLPAPSGGKGGGGLSIGALLGCALTAYLLGRIRRA